MNIGPVLTFSYQIDTINDVFHAKTFNFKGRSA
jgi:hypothetical protein